MLGGRKVAIPCAMALAKALQLPGRGGYARFAIRPCQTASSIKVNKNLRRVRLETQSKKLLALCQQHYPNWRARRD
eukprot:5426787-Pyramimonas_sp.AAC.1